jgi:putative oxidoreductase
MHSIAKNTAASRRYSTRMLVSMGIYAAINVAAILGTVKDLPPPARYGLALAVTAPIIYQLWAVLRFMEESDEFVRALLTRIMIMAWGITISLATAWGFLESYADAPHIQTWLIYPLFWGVFGLVSPFVRSTR